MQSKPFVVLTLLLLASVAGPLGSARAADLFVTDCGDTTPGGAPGQLRRLIADAAPNDTIHIPACLITLTGASGEDANASGDLDIGKNLSIEGAGLHQTVIDGGSLDRVFDIFAPATVTLSDLLIRNGRVIERGGGIRNGGTLTLNRVIVRANVATRDALNEHPEGGGIANDGALTLVESTVDSNVAQGNTNGLAGGIANTGALTLTRSTVSRNTVSGTSSSAGGIRNTGALNLNDSTVSSNVGGTAGPGGISNTSAMSAVGSAIVANISSAGAVNGVASSGAASLTNTIIANNLNSQCSSGVTSLGGNIATDTSCELLSSNDAVGNPNLGPLSDQGGPTQTHPLLPPSLAIDTALPGPCTATDQRGMPRPQDGDSNAVAICDKGPFEFTPPIFVDVPANNLARGAIEAFWVNGITAGCGATPLMFCPNDFLTRAQLAVFLIRSVEDPGYTPPPATGVFADVPLSSPFAPWIEDLFNRGITSGCGVSPARFCPDDLVTRAQLAVLVLRVLAVPGFVPPPAVGFYDDVPASNPYARFIEEITFRGLTSGCNASPPAYCPTAQVTRAQMATLLVRGFAFGF